MIKHVLIFASGAFVGAGISIILVKDHYKTKFEELKNKELEDMERYYIGKHPEKPPREGAYYVKDQSEFKNMNDEYVKPNKVDYTTYYKSADPAESEHPSEDDMDVTGESITRQYQEERGKPPRIIKASEYGDQDHFSTMSLLYYQENDTLTLNDDTSVEEIIYFDEIEDLIGDALTKFGFAENEEARIYVRNYKRGCDFEITKVFGAFEG